MNYVKANEWLKQNYPQLALVYEVRAITDELYITNSGQSEDAVFRLAPKGFVYIIARVRLYDDTWGGDVVLLMPEDV